MRFKQLESFHYSLFTIHIFTHPLIADSRFPYICRMSSPVICIGATLIDELYFCHEKTVAATSNPAVMKRYAGGVTRNIAQQLASLEIPVQLITVLGNDPDGEWLKEDCMKNAIGMDAVRRVDDNTGKYASILDADGSLYAAACTDPCGKYLDPVFLREQTGLLNSAFMIIADTNLAEESLSWLAAFSREKNIPLLIEPVSVAKACKLSRVDISGIFMITPNEDELPSLCKDIHDSIGGCMQELFERGVENIWLRKGEQGSEIFNRKENIALHAPVISITDSTGAGDAALAGWVAAYYHGYDAVKCLQAGHTLAIEVLQVHGAVIPGFTKEQLFHSIKKYYPDEQ